MTMVSGGIPEGFHLRTRPDSYMASDAAYSTGGNKGTYLARNPEDYPLNSQQKKVRDVAEDCGIEKGIDKSELQDKMVDCVADEMRS